MDVKLVVAKGKTAVKEIPLSTVTTIIGRKTDCGLRIPSPLVSRQHCELTRAGERLIVKDLGSSNGTFVNGSKIKQKELKSGDTLGVGPITFIVQLGGAVVSPSDTARPERAAAVAEAVADDAADFVVAEEVETSEAADFVAVEEAATAEEADFVVTAEEAAVAEEADFVVSEEATTAEEADFVVAEPAPADGDTMHDVNFADIAGGKEVAEAEIVEAVAKEAPEADSPPDKPKKKKAGLFGRLFKKKDKKKQENSDAPETPTPAPPAKSKKKSATPPKPAAAAANPAATDAPEFVAEDEEAPEAGAKPATEDDLADFLMGLNEKEQ